MEITNENHEVQYVNTAHEELTGYTYEDIRGKQTEDSPRSDKNKPELMDAIYAQLKKGKVSW